MEEWRKRAPEIAYLLNPAFCALLLYTVIYEYEKKTEEAFHITLLYLILPIVLHLETRKRINSRTNMVAWIQNNPDILVGFSERARNLIDFTNEAFEFLLHQEIIEINDRKVRLINKLKKSKINTFVSSDTEIQECVKKSEHIGRWFANMRVEENIYAVWGVKP